LGFAAHGAQKLFGWFGGYGLAGTGAFFESMGFRPGKLQAFLAGCGEFFGGLLVALGFLGPVGPALAAAVMVVAILAIHLKNGFFVTNNGYEVPLLYLASMSGLAFAGYGAYALDRAFAIGFSAPVDYAVVALGMLAGLAAFATRGKVPAVQPPGT
jgi:putative oxidoreductase